MGLDNYLELLAGLTMFLFGMQMMSEKLESTAGSKFRTILQTLTKNKYLGLLVGALFTMIIQSSSATTVMAVGLVNAGLMSLAQSVGVIFGANIGTTITAQLIAFKLTKIAPLLMFAGVCLMVFQKKKSLKNIGAAILGFGFLFFGLNTMSSAMKPLREMAEFQQLMVKFESPILGLLIGMAMTAVIQSSSASVGILQALAMQDLVGIESAVFIILGTNIGTCVTALLASIGTNKNAKRVAMIHLTFNAFGALIMTAAAYFLPIADWIKMLSPNNTVRQVANAHMGFKIVETLIFFPMSPLLVKVSQKIIKGEEPQKEPRRLVFVEDRLFATPTVLVAQLINEVERMSKIAENAISNAVEAFLNKDQELAEKVFDDEEVTDFLNHEITGYLVKASQLELSAGDAKLIGAMYHVINDLERIGDHAENIAEFAQVRIENKKLSFSDKAVEETRKMADKVCFILKHANSIFRDSDVKKASEDIAPLEQEIDDLEKKFKKRHIKRLKNGKCSPRAGTVFVEVLSNLERVADHSTNIAYSLLEDSREISDVGD